nr:hypothetical protein [uncultured Draconibacterium sp.]
MISLNVNSQNHIDEKTNQDTILYKSIFWSPQFYHQGNQIKLRDVSNILQADSDADRLMKSGKTIMTFGYIMAGTGGFILGYNINNNDPQLKKQNLTIGGVIVAGAFIVDFLATKKIKSAIDLYNSNMKNKTTNDLSLSLGLSQYNNGLGLKLIF